MPTSHFHEPVNLRPTRPERRSSAIKSRSKKDLDLPNLSAHQCIYKPYCRRYRCIYSPILLRTHVRTPRTFPRLPNISRLLLRGQVRAQVDCLVTQSGCYDACPNGCRETALEATCFSAIGIPLDSLQTLELEPLGSILVNYNSTVVELRRG